MASSENTVKAPDGRVWSITTSRRRRSFKESGKVPYFWAHLIVTTIMVLVFMLILRSDVFKILSILIVLVFLVWLAGFLNSLFRVTISANTVDPPPSHRLWLVTKRRRQKRAVREVAEAIRTGKDALEPEGTRLEEI